jgi:RNA polymerase sigma factor (sigma-70 family)
VAAEPSIGRATRVERPFAPGADAAGDLYERYSAQIHGYCLHQLGSREEAEDAVQTTFMNAFRGLSRGIVPELESAWLFKIAHNVCLSRRRSSWRRGKVEAPNNFEVLQEVIPGREQVSDELIGLQDVLEKMPENQRRAILLREWQGLTYREISTELGLTQAAVETLIFRARRALAQGLESDADSWKKRLRRGADVGGAIAFVKALLGGGGAAAVKVAATAMAVAATAVTAATEVPRHVQHASAVKPAAAATRHVTRQSAPTIRSTAAATAGSPAFRRTTQPGHPSSGERSLPKPVAVAASHPDATPGAPAPAQPSSEPAAPPAPAPSRPEPVLPPAASAAPSASAPAPADNGHGNGKADKEDRTPQSTTLPTETTSAPVVDPPAQESDQGRGRDKDKEKSDRSDNRNGNGDGNAAANTGAANSDRGGQPDKFGNGNDAGKSNDNGRGNGKGK